MREAEVWAATRLVSAAKERGRRLSESRGSGEPADRAGAHRGVWEFWGGEIECSVKGLAVVVRAFNSSTQETEADGTLIFELNSRTVRAEEIHPVVNKVNHPDRMINP